MQNEKNGTNIDCPLLSEHPNIDELWRFMHEEGDDATIRSFILLLENALSRP